MALTVRQWLALIALAFVILSLVPATAAFPLLAIAVLLLAIAILSGSSPD